MFHFLISIAQVLGMSADDVYAAYCKKNEVNHQRQDSGYTEKDEGTLAIFSPYRSISPTFFLMYLYTA